MSKKTLKNTGTFEARFENESINFKTNENDTTLISGLTATKTADQKFWLNGPLIYTVTVTNELGSALSDVVFIDHLDPSAIALDLSYGVYVDDSSVNYNFYTGKLSVDLHTIQEGQTVVITFRVVKI